MVDSRDIEKKAKELARRKKCKVNPGIISEAKQILEQEQSYFDLGGDY
jgi:hypothetical protein